ncbi:hypothetical protein BH09PSE3_BH09PSE3_21560 [soil metagenome]
MAAWLNMKPSKANPLPGGVRLGLFTVLLLSAPASARMTHYDLVIRGGTVLNGTGLPGRKTNVAIIGDRIVKIGALVDAHGAKEIDATGLYVTPGIVSVHDHTQPDSYLTADSLLTQGVTTAIANPDGGGSLDIVKQLTFAGGGPALNYGAYIGFNSIWREVMGLKNRRASADDIARMRALVTKGLEDGAFGLSAGLDYKPAFWATTAEVSAAAQAARGWRTNFPNHERLFTDNGYSSLAGMGETITIAENAGLMPVITHMKMQGRERGRASEALGLMTKASAQGHYTGADAYPYIYGNTSLEQLLIPAWAQEGGRDAMLARFKDPVLRKRIVAETQEQMDARWNGPDGVFLDELHKGLPAIMMESGVSSAGEMVVQLLERGLKRVILSYGTEADLIAILKDPRIAISCDCGARTDTFGHPRQWGSFPRFLGRYVREQKIVDWPEAIRKMTALPAAMVGLAERGYLLPGMVADVTLFDPTTIIDRATIDQPLLPSDGIRYVIINGKLALADGVVMNARAGVRLARSRHEPSRPMSFGADRSVRGSGTIAVGNSSIGFDIRMAQRAGSALPTGRIRIGKIGGKTLTVIQASVLQTAPDWASITGMGRWSDGTAVAATVQLERVDQSRDGKPSVTVLIDGAQVATGVLSSGALQIAEMKSANDTVSHGD